MGKDERQKRVQQFQEREEVTAAIVSIKAGGEGIELTAARLVIFAELSWTPSALLQAEGRVHRFGQANPVDVHYIVAPWPCYDEEMIRLLRTKGHIAETVVDQDEDDV